MMAMIRAMIEMMTNDEHLLALTKLSEIDKILCFNFTHEREAEETQGHAHRQ